MHKGSYFATGGSAFDDKYEKIKSHHLTFVKGLDAFCFIAQSHVFILTLARQPKHIWLSRRSRKLRALSRIAVETGLGIVLRVL